MAETVDKIAWHPAFYGGIELELRKWKADLIFETEHELSKEALLMDMLIIKKSRDIAIDSPYGRTFRTYNVVEYKSPEDTLNIDGFYKTIGYACLYKGLGESVDQIPAEEMTVSLFCSHHPHKLFRRLKELGVMVRNAGGGVYHVDGFICMPVQVVVTRELEANGEHPLRLLTRNVDGDELRDYVVNADIWMEPGDLLNAKALLNACVAANSRTFQQVKEGLSMTQEQAVRYALGDWIEEAEARGEARGEAKGAAKTAAKAAANMLRDNLPLHSIMKYCELPAEKIQEIASSIGVTVVNG